MSNFDTIKSEIEEVRKMAENSSLEEKPVYKQDEGINIVIKSKINKIINKRVVNYYLLVDLIDKIKNNAER